MPFLLQGEPLERIREILARQGGKLLGVRQVKGAKTYRVEVVADLDHGCGRRRYRFPEGIKYPHSNKGRRDFEAENRLEMAWRPSHTSSIVNRLNGTKNEAEAAAETALPTREKRPRECVQKTAVVPDNEAPRDNRGGAREGAGRRKGSYGKKRRLKLSQESAHAASRDIPASVPCRAVWERGLTYSSAVQKAVLFPGSAAAKAAGLEAPITVLHLVPAIALRIVYQTLLKGGTERQAFDATEFLDLDAGTIEAWELAYRTKGHIVV